MFDPARTFRAPSEQRSQEVMQRPGPVFEPRFEFSGVGPGQFADSIGGLSGARSGFALLESLRAIQMLLKHRQSLLRI